MCARVPGICESPWNLCTLSLGATQVLLAPYNDDGSPSLWFLLPVVTVFLARLLAAVFHGPGAYASGFGAGWLGLVVLLFCSEIYLSFFFYYSR